LAYVQFSQIEKRKNIEEVLYFQNKKIIPFKEKKKIRKHNNEKYIKNKIN
jgi:hypothetical protein